MTDINASFILPPSPAVKVRKPRKVWDIKLKPTTSLERAVVRLLKDGCDPSELASHIGDVCRYGCQSGAVSGAIYYSDTLKFYKSHRVEIQARLTDMLRDVGISSPSELFGDKWDTDDLFAQDAQNQNLLTWWAIEETARNLALEADPDGDF